MTFRVTIAWVFAAAFICYVFSICRMEAEVREAESHYRVGLDVSAIIHACDTAEDRVYRHEVDQLVRTYWQQQYALRAVRR